jgi:hypothetical protein
MFANAPLTGANTAAYRNKQRTFRSRLSEFGRTPGKLFGSLKNIARRLLDAVR